MSNEYNDMRSILQVLIIQCLLFCYGEAYLVKSNKQNLITLSEFSKLKNMEKVKDELTVDKDKNIRYTPDWPSLDSRPLPQWYDDAKVGIFIHWGVFSVPAFGKGFASEWFWEAWKISRDSNAIKFINDTQKPGFTYQDFARDFTADLFNPDEWAKLFEESGAKYVVLTTKHHDGYTLWPSKYSFSWNSMDVGPNRDLVGEFVKAINKRGSMKLGLYYSLYEWFNRLYLSDKSNKFSTQEFSKEKMIPEIKELIQTYRPELIWTDGEWEANSDYWTGKEFLSWYYNDAPNHDTVVANDRWGSDTRNKHGDFFTGGDHFNPGVLQKHKFENCVPIDSGSWGYRENAKLEEYATIENLIRELVTTVSCNGNVLFNVGPSSRGMIHPIFVDRLRALGKWLKINGEGVYGSRPWIYQKENQNIWYTMKKSGDRVSVFAFILKYPYDTNSVRLDNLVKFVDNSTKVFLLGLDNEVEFRNSQSSLEVTFPDKLELDRRDLTVSWTFKIDIPAKLNQEL